MRNFLVKTALFLLPILLAGAAMEWLLYGIPNEYRSKDAALRQGGDKIHTLILGSSHTYFGIDPDLMPEGAYNAAFVSQSLRYDSSILATRLDALPRLRTVVIPISYFSLFFQLESGQASILAKNYNLHLGIGTPPPPLERLEIVHSRLEKSIGKIRRHYLDRDTTPPCSPSGWGIAPARKATDMAASAKVEAGRHIGYVKTGRDAHLAENVNCLRGILRLCRARGIAVFLVTVPTTPEYSALLDPSVWSEIKDSVGSVLAEHPRAVYLDYSGAAGFEESDYFDADHLDSSGTAKFTALLVKSVDSTHASRP